MPSDGPDDKRAHLNAAESYMSHNAVHHLNGMPGQDSHPMSYNGQPAPTYPSTPHPTMHYGPPGSSAYHVPAPPMYPMPNYQHRMDPVHAFPPHSLPSVPHYSTVPALPGAVPNPVHGMIRTTGDTTSTVHPANQDVNLYPAPMPPSVDMQSHVPMLQVTAPTPQEGSASGQTLGQSSGTAPTTEAQEDAQSRGETKEKKKFLYFPPPPPDFRPPVLLYLLLLPIVLVFVMTRSLLIITWHSTKAVAMFTWNYVLKPIGTLIYYIFYIPYKYVLRPIGMAISYCSKIICPCIPFASCFSATGKLFSSVGAGVWDFMKEMGNLLWEMIKVMGMTIWTIVKIIFMIIWELLVVFWELFNDMCGCILKPIALACKEFAKSIWGTLYVIEAQMTGKRDKLRPESKEGATSPAQETRDPTSQASTGDQV